MNRRLIRAGIVESRVPHASGDEPEDAVDFLLRRLCSPREWG